MPVLAVQIVTAQYPMMGVFFVMTEEAFLSFIQKTSQLQTNLTKELNFQDKNIKPKNF